MPKFQDLSGQRFGRLTVIERAPDRVSPTGHHYTRWKCICDCGKQTVTDANTLKSGGAKSCGCLSTEMAKARMTNKFSTHNGTNERLFKVWCEIKCRCYNKNKKNYYLYGGRGIKMCDEWRKDYSAFRDWALANGYDKEAVRGKCTIDRVDVNKDYEPSNCRWVDAKTQGNNRRDNKYITYNGETLTYTQWSERLFGKKYIVWKRINAGWEEVSALTTPVAKRHCVNKR